MADKLTEAYDTWRKSVSGDPDLFQTFQGGLSTGASSMRKRAMEAASAAVKDDKSRNAVRTAIGTLPDIPE
jgi:hypothetical protein